jgi:hypothetical protein
MGKTYADIQKDAANAISGFNGTTLISGTNANTVSCIGYIAAVDTVIAALSNETHDLGIITGLSGKTVLAGQAVWFGCLASSITLTSGNGSVIRAEPYNMPAIPTLYTDALTNTGGTTITLKFSEVMSNPAAFAANFVVKVAGTAVPVASVALGTPASWIVVTPTTPLVKTDVVTITMQSTNIKSAAGAYFAGCANKAITNIVP